MILYKISILITSHVLHWYLAWVGKMQQISLSERKRKRKKKLPYGKLLRCLSLEENCKPLWIEHDLSSLLVARLLKTWKAAYIIVRWQEVWVFMQRLRRAGYIWHAFGIWYIFPQRENQSLLMTMIVFIILTKKK